MLLATSTGAYAGFFVLYVVLMVTLGITAIRKGPWVMFVIGIIVPIFWLIGAVMPPVDKRA